MKKLFIFLLLAVHFLNSFAQVAQLFIMEQLMCYFDFFTSNSPTSTPSTSAILNNVSTVG